MNKKTPNQAYIQEIEAKLMLGHSKAIAQSMSNWIGLDQEKMAAFMVVFLGDAYRLTQRGAWVLGHISKDNPSTLEPWLPLMVDALKREDAHVAVRRNVVRHFDMHGFPDSVLDTLADQCFTYLSDPNEAVAVRVFSMGVLEKVCLKVPELKEELRLLIEEYLPHGTAGFKSRGKKIIARLSK